MLLYPRSLSIRLLALNLALHKSTLIFHGFSDSFCGGCPPLEAQTGRRRSSVYSLHGSRPSTG